MVPHIIRHLNLDFTKIIVVTDRSQTEASIDVRFRAVAAGLEPFRNRWKTMPADWLRLHNNRKRVSQIVSGNRFEAYLPSPSDAICQQLIHHPLCAKYHLVEEGFGAYSAPNESPVRSKPPTFFELASPGARLRSLGYLKPVVTDYPFWSSKYAGAYGSNEKTFPDFPPPVINLNKTLYRAIDTHFTKLLIVDDLSIFTQEAQASYLRVIERLVEESTENGTAWAYKLHPRCEKWGWLQKRLEQIFRKPVGVQFTCQKLGPDACVEEIGLAHNTTTYGYMSVGLYYIHNGGGSIFSLRKKMEEESPEIRARWQLLFPERLERLVSSYPLY